jgi:hypothetical protein
MIKNREDKIHTGMFALGVVMMFGGLAGVWLDRYAPGFATMAFGLVLVSLAVISEATR